MIQMTYNEARAISRNRELVGALVTQPLTFRVGYNLRKILDKIGRAAQEFDLFEANLQKSVAEKFGKRGAEGKLVFEKPEGSTDEGDAVLQFEDEDRKAANTKMMVGINQFGTRTFQIDRDKLDLMGEKVQLRLLDLPLLDLFVKDPEADVGALEAPAPSDAPTSEGGEVGPEAPKPA